MSATPLLLLSRRGAAPWPSAKPVPGLDPADLGAGDRVILAVNYKESAEVIRAFPLIEPLLAAPREA